ncbi:MAG: DUF3667 domain-containing protein [Hydrogenophilaceae bacterium]|jgi:hypothetical protein|nr:DUF3667 domain-containing protein [Hydrogenophilaceae bacterium]
MSGELEAAGAAATAGLVAKTIEGRSGTRHGGGKCLNCGAALNGKYCAECGQPAHVHRTLGHVLEEFMHGVVHFDTKAWRTLPLLAVRPGTLTHNYIHGMRARYISPLAMFLFSIFTMFFVFALAGGPRFATGELSAQERAAALREAQAEIAQAREEVSAPGGSAVAVSVLSTAEQAAARQAVADERRAEQGARGAAVKEKEGAPSVSVGVRRDDDVIIGDGTRPWQDQLREAVDAGRVEVNLGNDALNQRVLEKLRNPDLALYKIQQAAYKFSFLLVPLSLPFVMLLFLWRKGVTLYDHVVFILYSLSFMSLLFIVVSLLSYGGQVGDVVGDILLFAVPAHMFFQLKGGYGLGWFSAAWRTILLLIFAMLALSLFIVFIILVGLAG